MMVVANEKLIVCRGVARRFGKRWALQELDLELVRGQIVGLAGPNGSGKSTLLRMIAGFMKPSRGDVEVFGLNPLRDRLSIMRRARFAFAPPPLYDFLSAEEHLKYLCGIGAECPSRHERLEALDQVGLKDRAKDRVGTFSFGMKQRLALAQALIPLPDLLVLDEPTDGLDPLAVLELRAILSRLREEKGVSILLASHLLIEIDQLVDHLVVLDNASCLFQGTPTALRGAERTRLEVDEGVTAASVLRGRGLEVEEITSHSLYVSDSLDLPHCYECLKEEGVTLISFSKETPSLEDALLSRLRESRKGEVS